MRIIGGKYKGRKIKYPAFRAIRPTKDRIREAVFNMIAEKLPGARVLDLFAGSGAYGLESLSRGAKEAIFVDNDKRCMKVLRDNIMALGAERETEAIAEDAFKAINLLGKDKERFDLIFSDPPFNLGMAKKTLITVSQYDILNHFGILVIEHHKKESVPEREKTVSIFKQKTYKNILISLYKSNE